MIEQLVDPGHDRQRLRPRPAFAPGLLELLLEPRLLVAPASKREMPGTSSGLARTKFSVPRSILARQRVRKAISRLRKALRERGADAHLLIVVGGNGKERE
jgi:hypothetical protein